MFFGSSATSAAACLRLLRLRSSPAPVASGAGAVEAVAMLSIVGYVSTVTLVYTILFLNKRMTVCLKVYSVTIDELLDECVELQEKLDESERRRKEAEALAKAYEKMLSKEQRDIAEALAINAANRSR